MKRATTVGLMLTAGLIFVGAEAQADATSAARTAVQAAYGKESAAFRRKDFNAIFAMYTPDYTNISPTGKVASIQELKQQIGALQMMKTISPKATITKFALKGSTAQCTVKEHVVLTTAGPNGKPATIIIDDTSDDTWVKSPKGWLKKRSKTLSQTQKALVDGKAVPLPGQ